MSKLVNVKFKLGAEDKVKMEMACDTMGLSMTTAFVIFTKKLEENVGFHLKYRLILYVPKII